MAGLREIGECTDEVATKAASVRLAKSTVRADIKPRELRATLIRCFGESAHIVLGPRDLIVDVFERADVDVAVGQLLDQDWGEPDDDAIGDPGTTQVMQEHEQR